jgi:Xylanase inhibitor N-terminal
LYKPAKGKIVPPRDSLCQELQGNQNYCATCRQCDYEIEYADRSSSVGVLARDEMHLVTSDAEREKLSFVFGYAKITTMLGQHNLLGNYPVHIQGQQYYDFIVLQLPVDKFLLFLVSFHIARTSKCPNLMTPSFFSKST